MADSKIDFSFENLHFSCEGEKDWVERQLNQVLNRIPGLVQPQAKAEFEATETDAQVIVSEPEKKRGRKSRRVAVEVADNDGENAFYQFLVDKKADKNQVRKFLATAVYLYSFENQQKFSTPVVSKTLKRFSAEKLLNASDCLNKNEKKGFCIKDEKEFTLTEAGIQSILGGE